MLLMQIIATYMVVSFLIGICLMMYDIGTNANLPIGLVTAFYIPPLALLLVGLMGALLSKIWS